MPGFKVVLQREIVEEIEVVIEAPEEESITNWCPSSTIYEGVAATKHAEQWESIVHDTWLDPDRVEATSKKVGFVLDRVDGDWVLTVAPKKPRVDPRQLPLLKEPSND